MRWLIFCLIASAAAAEGPVSMAPFPDKVADQFLAVGRVNKAGFKSKGNCSGTLIEPDVVLTAAHCTQTKTDGAMKKTFVAGYRRGAYVALRNFVAQERHPAYGLGGKHSPRFDLGLLFLDRPITEVAPILLIDTPQSGGTVALMGYHRVTPHVLTGRETCPVEISKDGLLLVDCPVISGNSGGPALRRMKDGSWRLAGVVSSRLKDKAVVVRVNNWVHQTIADYRARKGG